MMKIENSADEDSSILYFCPSQDRSDCWSVTFNDNGGANEQKLAMISYNGKVVEGIEHTIDQWENWQKGTGIQGRMIRTGHESERPWNLRTGI